MADALKDDFDMEEEKQEQKNPYSGFTLSNCVDLYEEKQAKLSTGCIYLNSILNGGFKSKRLIEIYGEYGTGKTCLAI